MTNWFYTDASGQKQGPINDQQLKTLAAKGVITRETVIENEQGKSAPAGRVKGLAFSEPPMQPKTTPVPAVVPVPNRSMDKVPVESLKERVIRQIDKLPIGRKPLAIGGVAVATLLVLVSGWWMMSGNSKEIDRFCTEYGTDVKVVDGDGLNILHIAAAKEGVAVIRFLINKGADVNAKANVSGSAEINAKLPVDLEGVTPLHYAALNNENPAVIKLLIAKGADVNNATADRMTPLHFAVKNDKNPDVVKLLIDNGAKIDARGPGGATPLYFAFGANTNPETIKLFIDNGADVNTKSDNKTPLQLAIEHNNKPEVIKLLIDGGADVLAETDRYNKTLLDLAKEKNNTAAVEIILRHLMGDVTPEEIKQMESEIAKQGGIHAKDDNGRTPLHRAVTAKNPNVKFVRFLVFNGADVNAKASNGWTPLHLTAMTNTNGDVAQFLISQGVNVNIKDVIGWTPLHYAAKNPNVDVAKFLVSEGADVNAKSNADLTPLDLAKAEKNTEVVKFLSRQK